MRTEISIRASGPSSSSRVFAWPVLEAGNGSYPNGIYSIICEDKERGKSFSLMHSVCGAPLINEWMVSGKTSFVCSVAAPRSMYKNLHICDNPEQLVEWIRDDLGEYPMFTPMIVLRVNITHIVNSAKDGLNHMWDGKELRLPKGARVAVGNTFKFQAGINGLLDFNQDDELEPGRYRLEPSTEDDFKFKVYLASDLHTYLYYHRNTVVGENIMTAVVTTAFSILHRDYSEDEAESEGESWRSFRNLQGLASLLTDRGLDHWSNENFKAEMVATSLYPHKLPPVEDVQ